MYYSTFVEGKMEIKIEKHRILVELVFVDDLQ